MSLLLFFSFDGAIIIGEGSHDAIIVGKGLCDEIVNGEGMHDAIIVGEVLGNGGEPFIGEAASYLGLFCLSCDGLAMIMKIA